MNMSQQSDSADPGEVCESEDLPDQIVPAINMSQLLEYTNPEQNKSEDRTYQKLSDMYMSQEYDFTDLAIMRELTCLKCSTPFIKREFMYLYSLSLEPSLTKARFLQCIEYLFNERRYAELFECMISAQKYLVDRVDKEKKYAKNTAKTLVYEWKVFGEYLEKLAKKLQQKKPTQEPKRKRKRNEKNSELPISSSLRCCDPEYLNDPKLTNINMSLQYDSVNLEEYKSRDLTDNNMKQQNDSADLVALREPTSLKSLIQSVKGEFVFLYAYTVEVNLNNCDFLPDIENCFNTSRYEKLLKEMLGRQKSVLELLHLHKDKEVHMNLICRWKKLGESLKQLAKKYQLETPKQVKRKPAESTFAKPENISQNDKRNSQSKIPTDVRCSKLEDRRDQELTDINMSQQCHSTDPEQYKSRDLTDNNMRQQNDSADLVALREQPTSLISLIQSVKRDFIILYSESVKLNMSNAAILAYMEKHFAEKRYGKLLRLMHCEQRNVLHMLTEKKKDNKHDLKRVGDWNALGQKIEQLQKQLKPGATKLVKRKLAESTVTVQESKVKRNEKNNESQIPTGAKCDENSPMMQDLSDDIVKIQLSDKKPL